MFYVVVALEDMFLTAKVRSTTLVAKRSRSPVEIGVSWGNPCSPWVRGIAFNTGRGRAVEW